MGNRGMHWGGVLGRPIATGTVKGKFWTRKHAMGGAYLVVVWMPKERPNWVENHHSFT